MNPALHDYMAYLDYEAEMAELARSERVRVQGTLNDAPAHVQNEYCAWADATEAATEDDTIEVVFNETEQLPMTYRDFLSAYYWNVSQPIHGGAVIDLRPSPLFKAILVERGDAYYLDPARTVTIATVEGRQRGILMVRIWERWMQRRLS